MSGATAHSHIPLAAAPPSTTLRACRIIRALPHSVPGPDVAPSRTRCGFKSECTLRASVCSATSSGRSPRPRGQSAREQADGAIDPFAIKEQYNDGPLDK